MRRWTILLGRGGTVLIAVSLALLLVSLIPAAQMVNFSATWPVHPKRFETPNTPFSEYVLTPQQSLRISITANGTLNVYLLEVESQSIYAWISEHNLGATDSSNITYFEEFLEANPQSIGWQEINKMNMEFEYVPTKITNATLVFSNPSSDFVFVGYEGSISSLVAPKTKVLTLGQWAISIGFVLTLPWLFNLLRTKTRRQGSQPLTERI